MLSRKIFPPETFPALKYVVIFSRYQGQWLFSRRRQRTTWETQGGHIEEGETPAAAARRELYEESGAEVRAFDALPDNVTYPAITPYLYEAITRQLA